VVEDAARYYNPKTGKIAKFKEVGFEKCPCIDDEGDRIRPRHKPLCHRMAIVITTYSLTEEESRRRLQEETEITKQNHVIVDQTLSRCQTKAGASDLRKRAKMNKKNVKTQRKEEWKAVKFARSGAKYATFARISKTASNI